MKMKIQCQISFSWHKWQQIIRIYCRFENAVLAVEKAKIIDCSNVDIGMLLENVKMVARARSRGNDLFRFRKYEDASSAYGEGLKYDPANPVLYCNRAVCWSKLGLWEKSIEDCNQALRIQPNYIKALFRRAASNGKVKFIFDSYTWKCCLDSAIQFLISFI